MSSSSQELTCDKTVLKAKYENQWKSILNSQGTKPGQGNKLRTYNKFKGSFVPEPYLAQVKTPTYRVALTQLQVSAHRLMIEQGRYKHIPVENRLCTECDELGDELHFVMHCQSLTTARTDLLEYIKHKFPHTATLNSENLFIWLMINEDADINNKIAKFIYEGFDKLFGSV